MDTGPTRWLLVSCPENFEISRGRGFDLAAMKSRHGRKAAKVRAGDTVLYYLTGRKSIAGMAEVLGPAVESHAPIWTSTRPGKTYPYRFPVRPVSIAANPESEVPVEAVVDRLRHASKWPRTHWTLAFQGNVHILPEEDHALLARALGDAVEAAG
ncbi:MAG: EVE domain-containing protein [Armatimonadota bacterium]